MPEVEIPVGILGVDSPEVGASEDRLEPVSVEESSEVESTGGRSICKSVSFKLKVLEARLTVILSRRGSRSDGTIGRRVAVLVFRFSVVSLLSIATVNCSGAMMRNLQMKARLVVDDARSDATEQSQEHQSRPEAGTEMLDSHRDEETTIFGSVHMISILSPARTAYM